MPLRFNPFLLLGPVILAVAAARADANFGGPPNANPSTRASSQPVPTDVPTAISYVSSEKINYHPVGDQGQHILGATVNANPCTWASSQLIPTDVPTASPYVSSENINYYPVGDQGKHILDASHPAFVNGPNDYPRSNSYALALQECSEWCDSSADKGHGQCLSFNVLTVYEDDFNNCVPTFECRFSNKTYDKKDYTTDNGTPSFAWTMVNISMPYCPMNVSFSPGIWIKNHTDEWLASYSRLQGLNGGTAFTRNLMKSLGWFNYHCDSPVAAGGSDCTVSDESDSRKNCAGWINAQMFAYFTYVNQIARTYDTWQTFMQGQGPEVYISLWNPAEAPPSAHFNYRLLVETAVNGVIGCIPDVGSFLAAVATIGEQVVAGVPQSVEVANPSGSAAWTAFFFRVSESMTDIAGQLDKSGAATGDSDAILQVMQDGKYFLEDLHPLNIDADSLWGNYRPYYFNQVALNAMQAQGVFLLRAPISGAGASTCSQKVADTMAGYLHQKNSNNVAWCDPDGKNVFIPVNGWNMDLYRVMAHTNRDPLNVTLTALGQSAWQCFTGFEPSHATISPYVTPKLTNFNFTKDRPDLTARCMWSIPVIDFNTWVGAAVFQSTSEGKYQYQHPVKAKGYDTLDFQTKLLDLAQWSSYQLGFQQKLSWCAWYGLRGEWQCKSWTWSKEITVK